MTHKPTRLDVKTDIQRSLMASFGDKKFEEENCDHFLNNALLIIESLNLSKERRKLIAQEVESVKNNKLQVEKRREDLLMISSLV
jgi:hypothetical protein